MLLEGYVSGGVFDVSLAWVTFSYYKCDAHVKLVKHGTVNQFDS